MAKKEVKTDFWVHGLLKDANITLEPQGSSIKEINGNMTSTRRRIPIPSPPDTRSAATNSESKYRTMQRIL